jgi:hypothetical protein
MEAMDAPPFEVRGDARGRFKFGSGVRGSFLEYLGKFAGLFLTSIE